MWCTWYLFLFQGGSGPVVIGPAWVSAVLSVRLGPSAVLPVAIGPTAALGLVIDPTTVTNIPM